MTYEEAEKHLEAFQMPVKTVTLLERMGNLFGINLSLSEYPIEMKNRGDWVYALGKGFEYTYCTSSMMDGPEHDYSEEIKQILCNCGFELTGSSGDNGLDSSSNWHDTYWTYKFVYKSSIVYIDE